MNYPVESFFMGIPLEQVEAILRDHHLPTTHVHTPYTLLYIDTGEHRVLVDTGIGQYGSLADKMFPTVDNTATRSGTLLENMRAAGINPDEVDTVIVTHAHPDHVGGNLDAAGELNFPNAQYCIGQDEWDFWFSDERTAALHVPPPMVQIARASLEPLRDRVTLIDSGAEILPGIAAIPTPGHTPGHMALSILSDGQQLIHFSDAVIHPLHLEYPDVLLVFDMLPDQTLASKRMICDRAADEKALVFAHHFPAFPNLGHIVKHLDGWRWQPS
jgi:glyoxylase-like metal-dependent hydrolase (beta-lactamase superfamily II)